MKKMNSTKSLNEEESEFDYEAFHFFPQEGDTIHDDLTSQSAKIVRISSDNYGNRSYWLDNDYLDGGRHPWEISPIRGDNA
jgi:hypothetical protein